MNVKRFSMTAGTLVGAYFEPILDWYCHLDSHCLRALCTIQRPRVSMDDLVRQTMLHRHVDYPPAQEKRSLAIRLGPWPSGVCIKLLACNLEGGGAIKRPASRSRRRPMFCASSWIEAGQPRPFLSDFF